MIYSHVTIPTTSHCANSGFLAWEEENPNAPIYQVTPSQSIAIPPATLRTSLQLELFNTVPQSYYAVEKLLEKLPRERQREYFRNLYLQKYREANGNRAAFQAGNYLRELLGMRLKKVFEQYHCNVSWIVAFDRDPQWLDEVMADVKAELKLTTVPTKEDSLTYKKELAIIGKMSQKYSKKQREDSKLPFYLITEKKLKEIAYKLANMLASQQREALDNFLAEYPDFNREQFNRFSADLYRAIGSACETIGFPLSCWHNFIEQKKVKGERMDTDLIKSGSEKYWFKRMRTTQKRMVEHIAIACGEVRKQASCYISYKGLSEWTQQQKKNHDFLRQMIIENIEDPSEQAELFDMYLKSSANPALLRREMMTRLNGLENWADESRHQALFLTLTAPSVYHATKSSGKQNKKWNGASPRATHEYLNKVWRQFRALLAKRKIKFYGMRVAEPHHDGTPHWHLLIYVNVNHVEESERLFKAKALEFNGNEKGAQEHRCKVEICDKQKGSATGYIAKYIAKNIDGYASKNEYSDEFPELDLKSNAKRARAWASCWGIRQFQFFGDKYVSVWRELRRMIAGQTSDEVVEEARICADIGCYASLMKRIAPAGPMAERKDVAIKLYYEESEPNQYGETRKKIDGIKHVFSTALEHIKTRLKKWKIKKGDPNRHQNDNSPQGVKTPNIAAQRAAQESGHCPPWTCVNNCNRLEIERRIQKVVEPLMLPLNKYQIDYLLNGNRLILNKRQAIQIVDNEIQILKLNQPLHFATSGEPRYLQNLRNLHKK